MQKIKNFLERWIQNFEKFFTENGLDVWLFTIPTSGIISFYVFKKRMIYSFTVDVNLFEKKNDAKKVLFFLQKRIEIELALDNKKKNLLLKWKKDVKQQNFKFFAYNGCKSF